MKVIVLIISLIVALTSCSNRQSSSTDSNINSYKGQEKEKPKIQYNKKDSLVLTSIHDSIANIITNENLKISYIHGYNPDSYRKDYKGKYAGYVSAKVDTSDYIVKILEGQTGKYVVIGYNHTYDFYFKNGFDGKPINFQVDKKRDLSFLLEGLDYWIESNLDVWSLITISAKKKVIIFEYNINPRYNYGDSYYLVFDSIGQIKNCGYNLSWGGDGADGNLGIVGDFLLTCNEIYDINKDKVLKYTKLPTSCRDTKNMTEKEKEEYLGSIRTTHGMRVIDDSTFIVIYNRPGGYLDLNGFIYTTKLDIVGKFRYHGLAGEMDAKLLVNEKYSKDSIVFFDYIRKSLILISKQPPYGIYEIESSKIVKADKESINNLDIEIVKNDFPEFIVKRDTSWNYYYYENEY